MTTNNYRLVNRDGSFNIARQGIGRGLLTDAYHRLLSMGWPGFIGVLLGFYLALNFLFALGYLACGEGALEGASRGDWTARFSDCFFFSVQTLATIGYGKITPGGLGANCLVTIEALFGLMGLALMTGLLFARFSRPTARVRFSRRAVISLVDGVPCFMFRMANERFNQIVEAKVRLSFTRDEVTAEGERYRNFYPLALEREESPLFALSWTVVHPITDSSPLKGLSLKDLEGVRAEFFVSLTGIDETFSQAIHTRVSYLPSEVVRDAYFADMITRDDAGRVVVDLAKIHDFRSEDARAGSAP